MKKQRTRLNKSYIYVLICNSHEYFSSFFRKYFCTNNSAQEYNYRVISTPISLRMTFFKTGAGTMLTKETLVCTRNEWNFVQLSNFQAVFSANAARKSRLLRCFSPLPTLPHPFSTPSNGILRDIRVESSSLATYSDDPPTLNSTWRSNLSVLYRWKLEVSLVELLQRYGLSVIFHNPRASLRVTKHRCWLRVYLFGRHYTCSISNWRNLVNWS